jgi:short-subunit dehydrogenase
MKGQGERGMADERRWTVVTGASSGIGAELARVFGQRGRSLVLVARRRDRLEELAGDLRSAHGVAVEVVACDLARPDAPEELLGALEARGIAVDTLVNNAGFGLLGAFAELPYGEQLGMLQLNVVSVTQLCRLVLPGLLARRRGGILNVASTAAFQAGPRMAVYYATKAFVLLLSEALHEEAKPHGVTVTALCPGPTPTEFQARADMKLGRLLTLGAMSATDVARIGVEGYEKGRAVVIPGLTNRLGALGAKLLPRFVARGIAARLQA